MNKQIEEVPFLGPHARGQGLGLIMGGAVTAECRQETRLLLNAGRRQKCFSRGPSPITEAVISLRLEEEGRGNIDSPTQQCVFMGQCEGLISRSVSDYFLCVCSYERTRSRMRAGVCSLHLCQVELTNVFTLFMLPHRDCRVGLADHRSKIKVFASALTFHSTTEKGLFERVCAVFQTELQVVIVQKMLWFYFYYLGSKMKNA